MPNHRWVKWVSTIFFYEGRTLIKHLQGNDQEEDDSDRDLPTTRKKTKYTFDMDDGGYVILPDPDEEGDMKLAKMEQLIRAFLSIHYRRPVSFNPLSITDDSN
jgi:hypothetical protein